MEFTPWEHRQWIKNSIPTRLSEEEIEDVIAAWHQREKQEEEPSIPNFLSWLRTFARNFMGEDGDSHPKTSNAAASYGTENEQLKDEAMDIVDLLGKNVEEIDSVINALNGGYVKPAPGGDLLRDGTSVLPTGRNIHALDPYRLGGKFLVLPRY